jgi:hypothetical protein
MTIRKRTQLEGAPVMTPQTCVQGSTRWDDVYDDGNDLGAAAPAAVGAGAGAGFASRLQQSSTDPAAATATPPVDTGYPDRRSFDGGGGGMSPLTAATVRSNDDSGGGFASHASQEDLAVIVASMQSELDAVSRRQAGPEPQTDCLLRVHHCTRSQSPHPLPWTGHSFPLQLIVTVCLSKTVNNP